MFSTRATGFVCATFGNGLNVLPDDVLNCRLESGKRTYPRRMNELCIFVQEKNVHSKYTHNETFKRLLFSKISSKQTQQVYTSIEIMPLEIQAISFLNSTFFCINYEEKESKRFFFSPFFGVNEC